MRRASCNSNCVVGAIRLALLQFNRAIIRCAIWQSPSEWRLSSSLEDKTLNHEDTSTTKGAYNVGSGLVGEHYVSSSYLDELYAHRSGPTPNIAGAGGLSCGLADKAIWERLHIFIWFNLRFCGWWAGVAGSFVISKAEDYANIADLKTWLGNITRK